MIEMIKTAIRPAITVSLVWGVLLLIILKISIPDWLVTLTTMTVSFWFAERSSKYNKEGVNGSKRQN